MSAVCLRRSIKRGTNSMQIVHWKMRPPSGMKKMTTSGATGVRWFNTTMITSERAKSYTITAPNVGQRWIRNMGYSCRDCDKRYPGCHDSCEAYQKFKEDLDARNKKIKESKQNQLEWERYRNDKDIQFTHRKTASKMFKSRKK